MEKKQLSIGMIVAEPSFKNSNDVKRKTELYNVHRKTKVSTHKCPFNFRAISNEVREFAPAVSPVIRDGYK